MKLSPSEDDFLRIFCNCPSGNLENSAASEFDHLHALVLGTGVGLCCLAWAYSIRFALSCFPFLR